MEKPELGSRMRIISAALAALAALPGLDAHSSLISPIPRNAIDRDVAPWKGRPWGPGTLPGSPPIGPGIGHCEHPAHSDNGGCWGCTCVNGTAPCTSGQTCVYFSQGCAIGCKSCDGKESNPNRVDRCNSGMAPTNNDARFRTYNRDAPAMSAADWTQHNPWRAPGAAPVYDACGMAGGSPTWVSTQLSYIDTVHAKQGDLGSKVLPPAPTGVVWQRGSVVEAKWSVRANHGGGYQYRLCPRSSPLTEECMQATPIEFARRTYLEWGNGTRVPIQSQYLSAGTRPANSTWAMMPLPFSDNRTAPQFEPPCRESVDRHRNDTGDCSGRFPWDVSIIDALVVPEHLRPGEWVLGFRWDCEATAQIWSSCADIEIA